ncbi:MAG: beta-ketoacyl-ACP synthase [Deltaproteobacteria bacterium]|nr:beta-ketoacyl-ACP synthase [Nannocystaceae bacterium]
MSERRRVVVTGLGLVSPIGNSLNAVSAALRTGSHGIRKVDAWAEWGVRTGLGGVVDDVELVVGTRKQLRAMGKVARLAVAATHAAIVDAGLDEAEVRAPSTLLVYGSTDGSTGAAEEYYRRLYTTRKFEGLLSSSYLKFMSHTCAANLAQVFGITGRVLPICSACTSASQSIGEGYHAIASGRDELAICGGAEELHVTVAGVFDLMMAASVRYNDHPELTPRPFDRARDGMVVGEGAGTLVLESWEHAQRRGARAWAEIVGYGSNCDGAHLTSPSPEGMAGAMRLALRDAGLDPAKLDYVNAHATGTEVGDIAESLATAEAIGTRVPLSSTKGHTGHTLGGCGAIESIFAIAMMQGGFVAPTRNLDDPDPRCAPLAWLRGDAREAKLERVMNNNFAFGGINTALILAKV